MNNVSIIEKSAELLSFLVAAHPSVSRNKVKSFLAHRQVIVNGMVCTQFDKMLAQGDRVEVLKGKGSNAFRHPMMRIVHEDDAIIVIEKRNGLLSVGTDKERTKTAFYLLSEHVKRADLRNRIFIIHRLDRETSGLMMFAKSEQIQSQMQRGWSKMVRDRSYVAVVEGALPAAEGVVEAPLTENKVFKVYVDPAGENAVTGYKVLRKGAEYSLVKLTLDTGKKNQIRAHMEHVGAPVAGDKKYGAQTNPIGRVCLHARVLNIVHPVTGENMDFSTAVPQLFEKVVAGKKFARESGAHTDVEAGAPSNARGGARKTRTAEPKTRTSPHRKPKTKSI